MASEAGLFAATKKFKEAISILNGVTSDKFPLLLSRIVSRLHLRAERVFSDEEEAQLRELLGVSAAQLGTILDASSFVFEQAAFHVAKPGVLESNLRDAGLGDTQTEAFRSVWEAEGGAFVNRLREDAWHPPLALEDFNWRLNLQMGQNGVSRMKNPSAVFEFSLQSAEKDGADKFVTEMSRDQLLEFLNALDTVQEQVDALT